MNNIEANRFTQIEPELVGKVPLVVDESPHPLFDLPNQAPQGRKRETGPEAPGSLNRIAERVENYSISSPATGRRALDKGKGSQSLNNPNWTYKNGDVEGEASRPDPQYQIVAEDTGESWETVARILNSALQKGIVDWRHEQSKSKNTKRRRAPGPKPPSVGSKEQAAAQCGLSPDEILTVKEIVNLYGLPAPTIKAWSLQDQEGKSYLLSPLPVRIRYSARGGGLLLFRKADVDAAVGKSPKPGQRRGKQSEAPASP